MKRVGDAVSVGQSQAEVARPDNGMCVAYGCPLPGGISHSTLGGGPWYCRFHSDRKPSESDAITTEIRRKLRDGEPLDRPGPTPTVAAMREAMHKRARVTA